MHWEIFLPTEATQAEQTVVTLIGLDYRPKEKHKSTWKLIVLLRNRGVVHMYALLEHGRRLYRSMAFTSNSRFAHHNLSPDEDSRRKPWLPPVRQIGRAVQQECRDRSRMPSSA
eukprot:TRINITY_DN111191_c0_g1_i2.p1 TRINITY_DN111191_c0_g1~~TRINITY_DN111191_c0_g1_i2.p1  ORF type:complete len:114 (+),score=19.64 TRINITY_DN111191_c0_g1_i2:90-431(+)